MSVDSITETWDTGIQSKSDSNGKVIRTANRGLQVVVTDPTTDTAETVRAGLAAVGITNEAAHPTYGTAYRCKNVGVKRKTPILFDISTQYETPPFDSDDPDPSSSLPWQQPAVVKVGDVSVDGAIEEDLSGAAILTKANERFEGLTRQFSDMQLIITKDFLSFSSSAFYTYKDAVNSDTFLGYAPGLLRVTGLSADEAFHDGQRYSPVTVVITVRKPYKTTVDKAWWLRVLHQGWNARKTIGGEPDRAIYADSKAPTSTPALLDVNGVQLPKDGTPEFLEFEVYESVAFSGMGLF